MTREQVSRRLSHWDTTWDGTRDVMHQSQSQSQSQSPFLRLTAVFVANHCPASTTDRARSSADHDQRSTFNAHAASRGANHQGAAMTQPDPDDVATDEEARTWAARVLAFNPHHEQRKVARWILATNLDQVRALSVEWANADTDHPDDFLRGHAQGMVAAGETLMQRIGGIR